MKRLTLVLLFLTFCATAFAGGGQVKKTTDETMKTPNKAVPGRSASPAQEKKMADAEMMARCQEMMEQKQKMKDDMKAQDDQLTRQLTEMNQAPEDKKLDLMAAALTQMVQQRIAMDERKAKMEEAMMQHMMQHMQMGKESMAQCPMMKGMKDMKGMQGMKGMTGMDQKSADANKELQKGQK